MPGEAEECEISFWAYSSRHTGNGEDRSGAYLFMPGANPKRTFGVGVASPFRVIRGTLYDEVHVLHEGVVHQRLTLYKAGLEREAIAMQTFVDIRGKSNFELVMRINSDLDNNVIHTDMNGLTITRKRYYDKLHVQGNVYPVVTAAYLQDSYRMTY